MKFEGILAEKENQIYFNEWKFKKDMDSMEEEKKKLKEDLL